MSNVLTLEELDRSSLLPLPPFGFKLLTVTMAASYLPRLQLRQSAVLYQEQLANE